MPRHYERNSDGSYTSYSEEEWREKKKREFLWTFSLASLIFLLFFGQLFLGYLMSLFK